MGLRDRSLITGKGSTKREGRGAVKFYPYKKEGGRKSFSYAEGGQKKFWG